MGKTEEGSDEGNGAGALEEEEGWGEGKEQSR